MSTKDIILMQLSKNTGDFFKCTNSSCGYTVRMRVLGNTAKCSQCGSIMRRI